METLEKRPLSAQERQANVDRIIKIWKKGREEDIKESKERFKTPEFQAILKDLRKRNAEKGIIIPEL
jgi:phosphatidylserine/phosphatidylglycerophosphate/cardiolipin synthase-like enzyme